MIELNIAVSSRARLMLSFVSHETERETPEAHGIGGLDAYTMRWLSAGNNR